MAFDINEIHIHIFMFIALLVFMFIALLTLDRKAPMTRTYFIMGAIVLTLLGLEAWVTVIEGMPGMLVHVTLSVGYVVIFLLGLFLSFYWYLIMKRFFKHKYRRFLVVEYLILFVQITIISVVVMTPFTRQVFYIDEHNIYHRSYGFFSETIAGYYYPIFALFILIKERKYIIFNDFVILLISITLPLVSGVLQLFNFGLMMIWPSTALSLMITYVFLRQKSVQYDALTGAWRRGSLFDYIKQRNTVRPDDTFGIIYFDLNNLKHINDTFGHQSGDDAIVSIVKIIKNVIQKQIIVRMGGDEFIAVIETKYTDELIVIMNRINDSIGKFNIHQYFPFDISVSMGSDVFDHRKILFDDFLDHVDKLMYQDKMRYRQVIK